MGRVACFTGHRPEKLGLSFTEGSPGMAMLSSQLQERILTAVDHGYDTFLCGMARGIDILAGEILLTLQEPFPNLRLTAVLAFPGQDHGWPEDWRRRYRRLLRYSGQVVSIGDRYRRGCYLERDRYLVDHSSRLIGVLRTGSTGGTAYTVRYALQRQLEIDLLRLESKNGQQMLFL